MNDFKTNNSSNTIKYTNTEKNISTCKPDGMLIISRLIDSDIKKCHDLSISLYYFIELMNELGYSLTFNEDFKSCIISHETITENAHFYRTFNDDFFDTFGSFYKGNRRDITLSSALTELSVYDKYDALDKSYYDSLNSDLGRYKYILELLMRIIDDFDNNVSLIRQLAPMVFNYPEFLNQYQFLKAHAITTESDIDIYKYELEEYIGVIEKNISYINDFMDENMYLDNKSSDMLLDDIKKMSSTLEKTKNEYNIVSQIEKYLAYDFYFIHDAIHFKY